MFVIGFQRSGTDSKFLCDPASAEAGAGEREDMQLAISQLTSLGMRWRMVNHLVKDARVPGKRVLSSFTKEMPSRLPRKGSISSRSD